MKNILVAGGTDGIGLAFVKHLKTVQYEKIYILGREFSLLEDHKASNAIFLRCDSTNENAIGDVLSHIDQPLDQFVNTIGTFYRNPIDKNTSADVFEHFRLNSIANINLANAVLSKLNGRFAEVLVCLATIALEARKNYSLQSATKAAYKYYLDTLRIEKLNKLKVIAFYPSSVTTNVFKKADDTRDTTGYPTVDAVSNVMHFMLAQPRERYAPELRIENFR